MDKNNKKRLYLAALGISGALTLTACGKDYGELMDDTEKNHYFTTIDDNYKENEPLSYDIVSKMYVVFLTGTNDAYILMNIDGNGGYDYFTGCYIHQIIEYDNDDILFITKDINYYLLQYGMIKEYYNRDDLRQLLEQIKNDYELEYNDKLDKDSAWAYKLVKKENK